MGMTPKNFFDSFVEGNYDDCISSPGDIRRAFNAAVSTSHFADHFFQYNKLHNPSVVATFNNKIGNFVEHLSMNTNGAFKDIRSISNAYKHLYEHIGSCSAYSSVNSAGSIEAIDLSDDDLIKSIEEDYSSGAVSKVVFTRKDGTKSDFLPILEAVVKYLRHNY